MVLTAHSSERFSYTRVQSIALDLNTNFTKTAVFLQSSAQIRTKLNNFTAPFGAVFLYPKYESEDF